MVLLKTGEMFTKHSPSHYTTFLGLEPSPSRLKSIVETHMSIIPDRVQ